MDIAWWNTIVMHLLTFLAEKQFRVCKDCSPLGSENVPNAVAADGDELLLAITNTPS